MLSSVSWTTRAMQCHLPSSRTGAASLASGSSSSSLGKLKKKKLARLIPASQLITVS